MKYCKKCDKFVNITEKPSLGITPVNNIFGLNWRNCECGSTLVEKEYIEPKTVQQKIDAIDDVCADMLKTRGC